MTNEQNPYHLNNVPSADGFDNVTRNQKRDYAKELINCFWLWNLRKSDARQIIRMMDQMLPATPWPEKVRGEPDQTLEVKQ